MNFTIFWSNLVFLLASAQLCLSQNEPETDTSDFTSIETLDGVSVSLVRSTVLKSRLTTVFLPIVFIIVFVVGLPTNAVAIWVFLFRTKKKHPAAIYMANLALSDLLFVIWMPLKIAYRINGNNWIYGEGLCKFMVGFFYGNMYSSIAFIACISVQRYWAVVHPLTHSTRDNRVAITVSITVWIVFWLTTTPLYLYDQTVKITNMDIVTCHDIPRPSQKYISACYFLTMGILGFVVPTVVCIVANVLMLKALRDSITDPSMTDANISQKRHKAVVLIIIVLVMFLVCFTPSNIMLLVHNSLLLAGVRYNGYGFYITTLCLANLNSCVDPFVYYFISEEFREHVKNTLKCRSERTVERMRVNFSFLKYSRRRSARTPASRHTPHSGI